MSLATQYKLDDRERVQRKLYLQLDDKDIQILRDLLPTVERHVQSIVEDFYKHLFRFAEPRQFFGSAGLLERVKLAQREYVLDIFRGNYDEAYFERRLQIGVAHDRIGLPAKWYLGSNSIFLQLITPLLARRFRLRPFKLVRAVLAVTKIMNLDEQLVMDTYIGTMVERVRGLADRISRAIEILAPTARESAGLAEDASRAATKAMQLAEQGTANVEQSLVGMSELKAKSLASTQATQRLSEQSGQIEEIIKLIDRLTNDTNLLALNAAVQAARAGEQSRGFGVVAEEIRKLADESRALLVKVHGSVANIREATQSAVRLAQESTSTVDHGTHLVQSIGTAFNDLSNSSRTAAVSVDRIASTARRQADALQELEVLVEERERRYRESASSGVSEMT